MAKLLKLRRGTTTQHGNFTGAEGECTVDMDKDVLVIHDGTTQGGHPVAAEDMSNVSSASIAGRLSDDSIATSKIAAGALPTDVTIADANISGNLTIATNDINNNSVDFSKLQDIDQNRIIGRVASGSGDATTLTAANVRTMINVEDGATADQSAAEIRALVQSAADSNVFTDADHSKLDNIQSGATDDQTSAEIKALLASNQLTSSHLGTDSVTSGKIVNLNVTRAKIANDAINGDKIADDSINSEHYVDGSIDDVHLANNSVATSKIPNNAVTFAKIEDVAQNRILGRVATGTGDITTLTAANVRSMINVADGATSYTSNQATNTSSNVTFGTINCSSLTATGNVTAFSDATLKTEIHTINEALGIVGKLRGVTYKWLSNGEADIGVIAQEVQEVVPEVVKETVDGLKTVDYGRLVSVLINAVNELNEKLDKHIEGGK